MVGRIRMNRYIKTLRDFNPLRHRGLCTAPYMKITTKIIRIFPVCIDVSHIVINSD